MKKVANREAIDGVQKLHRGLHMAMDELINRKDYETAREILLQIDYEMVEWIKETKVQR